MSSSLRLSEQFKKNGKDKYSLNSLIIGELLIEVFVHSHSEYMDVSTYRELSQHAFCAHGLADVLVSDTASKFKGRIFSQEDLTVLEQVLEMAKARNKKVRVYDVSRVTDKIRALKRGVLKTPTVIVHGERYEELKEISQAILSNPGP
jgi:hypothetical protein